MPYTLPKLNYSFDALEPHIDARTMEIHYGKHHQTYCDNANKFLAGTALEGRPIEEVLKNLDQIPADKRTAVRNHGGGFANHNFFWTCLSPKSAAPTGKFSEALQKSFGSLDTFKEKFETVALGQFGSGWAWLVVKSQIANQEIANPTLEVINLPNQDSPLSIGQTPLLCLDVWEHAYYLKYQNRRAEYVKAFWNIVNWGEVERRFSEAS
ncbi:MAG: superoxide dismutase [Candidatus Peribacter sp.]|nr:superoxide dismutase [Candidatus Peribacter sp.]